MADFTDKFNQKYKETPNSFGEKPMQIVENITKYKKQGAVLDLGVGNGRNTIYLLSKGFNVTGIDSSSEGLQIIKEKASENVNLKLIESDVNKYSPKEKYDIILAIGLLHFLTTDQIDSLVKKMQNWTKSNGLNVIAVRMTQNLLGDLLHIFQENELKEHYTKKNWKILEYKEVQAGTRKIAIIISQKS